MLTLKQSFDHLALPRAEAFKAKEFDQPCFELIHHNYPYSPAGGQPGLG
jgi:hypothetical protein